MKALIELARHSLTPARTNLTKFFRKLMAAFRETDDRLIKLEEQQAAQAVRIGTLEDKDRLRGSPLEPFNPPTAPRPWKKPHDPLDPQPLQGPMCSKCGIDLSKATHFCCMDPDCPSKTKITWGPQQSTPGDPTAGKPTTTCAPSREMGDGYGVFDNVLSDVREKAEKHLAHLLPKDGTPITWEDDGVSYKIWYDHGVRMNSWSPERKERE